MQIRNSQRGFRSSARRWTAIAVRGGPMGQCRSGLIRFDPENRFQAGPCSVPEGHAIIAQRFNVGTGAQRNLSPVGTVDGSYGFQPSLWDLRNSALGNPTLKRWAIIKHPSGMKTRLANRGVQARKIWVRMSRRRAHSVGHRLMGSLNQAKPGKLK